MYNIINKMGYDVEKLLCENKRLQSKIGELENKIYQIGYDFDRCEHDLITLQKTNTELEQKIEKLEEKLEKYNLEGDEEISSKFYGNIYCYKNNQLETENEELKKKIEVLEFENQQQKIVIQGYTESHEEFKERECADIIRNNRVLFNKINLLKMALKDIID